MDLSKFRIMNAAGMIKGDGTDFRNLLRSSVTDVVFGSITVPHRQGNSGNNFVWTDEFSVNSIGLKNDGVAKYYETLPPLIKAARDAGKRFVLSVAPLQLEDAKVLAEFAMVVKPDVVELNLGCPNVHDMQGAKRAFSYDVSVSSGLVFWTKNTWAGSLWLKMSPFKESDLGILIHQAKTLGQYLREGDGVVTCNTEGNFAPKENGEPFLRAIDPDGKVIHAGGMGGRKLRTDSLSNLVLWNMFLEKGLERISVGGIAYGLDLLTSHQLGATGVQIGTEYFKTMNPRIFSDVQEQATILLGHTQ